MKNCPSRIAADMSIFPAGELAGKMKFSRDFSFPSTGEEYFIGNLNATDFYFFI
jgi:hypothetical protein